MYVLRFQKIYLHNGVHNVYLFMKSAVRSVHFERLYTCWAAIGFERCRQQCDGIVANAVDLFYPDTRKSRCNFCATQLIHSLFRKQRLKDSLYLAGCKSFLSIKRNGSSRTGYLYYFEQSNSKISFFLLSDHNGCSVFSALIDIQCVAQGTYKFRQFFNQLEVFFSSPKTVKFWVL